MVRMRSAVSHVLTLVLGVFIGLVAATFLAGAPTAPTDSDSSARTAAAGPDRTGHFGHGGDEAATRRPRTEPQPTAEPRDERASRGVQGLPTPAGSVPPTTAPPGAADDPEHPSFEALLDALRRSASGRGAVTPLELAKELSGAHPDREVPPGLVYDVLQARGGVHAEAAVRLAHSWGEPTLRTALEQELRSLPTTPSEGRLLFLATLFERLSELSDRLPATELGVLLSHRSAEARALGVELVRLEDPESVDTTILDRVLLDPAPSVRAAGLWTASDWLDYGLDTIAPQRYRDAAQAGLRDPDGRVREAASWLVASMGSSGADLALEVLRSGAPDPDLRHSLAYAVALSPRAAELLDGDPPEVHVQALLDAAGEFAYAPELELEPEDELVRSRLVELLPRLVRHVEDRDSLEWTFQLAVSMGANDFVTATLHDAAAPFERRRAALSAIVAQPEVPSDVAPSFERLLDERRASPAQRRELIEVLRDNLWINSSENAAFRAVVDRIAENDPSPWVRDVAREFLAEGAPDE